MRRRLLALVALVLVVGGTAAPATAVADPPQDPVIRFEGPANLIDSEGNVVGLSIDLAIDCSDDPCTVLVTTTDGTVTLPLTNDEAVPVLNGQASVAFPEYGALCDLRWIGAGQFDLTATGSQATISRTSAAGGPVICGDGSEATANPMTISGVLSYVSGSTCLLDDSCPTPTPTPAATSRPTATPTGSDPSAPGALSELPTTHAALTVANAAWAVGGAIVLVLLVAFPSVLLDSATERGAAWIAARRRRRGRLRDTSIPPLTVVGWGPALIGLLVSAVASVLVDPRVGPDLAGLRVLVSVLGSFLIAIGLGWAVVAVAMRISHPRSRPRLEFRPLTLLVVAGAVVFSRLTGFEPGIVFGLVAGVGFGAILATVARARAALLALGYTAAVAVAAWIGYSLLRPILSAEDWAATLASETLSAIAIAGLSALPIALLPVRGLTGHAIWSWSRLAWAAAYTIAVAGFLLVLMPLPESWQRVRLEIWAWVGLYAAYAVIAVVVWLIVVRPWRRERTAS